MGTIVLLDLMGGVALPLWGHPADVAESDPITLALPGTKPAAQ
jgi:hypothetical protein